MDENIRHEINKFEEYDFLWRDDIIKAYNNFMNQHGNYWRFVEHV